MFDAAREHYDYEENARYDYYSEAFGDEARLINSQFDHENEVDEIIEAEERALLDEIIREELSELAELGLDPWKISEEEFDNPSF